MRGRRSASTPDTRQLPVADPLLDEGERLAAARIETIARALAEEFGPIPWDDAADEDKHWRYVQAERINAALSEAWDALIARVHAAETERKQAEDRAEVAEFRYAQEREFSIDAAQAQKETRALLSELCDAFKQVYEASYGPAPAGENGSYHAARRHLGEEL